MITLMLRRCVGHALGWVLVVLVMPVVWVGLWVSEALERRERRKVAARKFLE